MDTILIFGSSGVFGKAMLRYLNGKKNINVYTANRKIHSKNEINVDIRNREEVENVILKVKPDLIFNLTGSYSSDENQLVLINLESSRFIMETLLKFDMKSTRVLLIGSASEYGIVENEENPITEQRVLRPISFYGVTKAWQTQLCSYYAFKGIKVIVGRVFNVLGSGISDTLFVGRVQKQINEILQGEREFIQIGNLSSIRDYISIDNAVEQLFVIIKKGIPGEVYHVASGQPVTMRYILNLYLVRNGLDFTIVRESEKFSNRVGFDVPTIYADISKTSALLKYTNKNEFN